MGAVGKLPSSPMAANGAAPGAAPLGQWTTGLFDCMDDLESCCLSFWCTCIPVGQVANILDRGQTSCFEGGLIFTALHLLTGFGCVYTYGYRKKLRKAFQLPAIPANDILSDALCLCCSVAQTYRELKNRNIDPALGYACAPPGSLPPANHVGHGFAPPNVYCAPNPNVAFPHPMAGAPPNFSMPLHPNATFATSPTGFAPNPHAHGGFAFAPGQSANAGRYGNFAPASGAPSADGGFPLVSSTTPPTTDGVLQGPDAGYIALIGTNPTMENGAGYGYDTSTTAPDSQYMMG